MTKPKPKPKLTPAKARMAEAAKIAKDLDEAFKRDAEAVEKILGKDPTKTTPEDRLFMVKHGRTERARWDIKLAKKEAKKEEKADAD